MGRDAYLRDGGMGATAIATVMGLMAFAPERPAVAHVSMTAREVSEGVKAYKIPQGSAAEALNRLADESGVRMIYRAQLTKNLQTRGLSGNYTLTGALDALLSGTGLQYRLSEMAAKFRSFSRKITMGRGPTQFQRALKLCRRSTLARRSLCRRGLGARGRARARE